MRLLPVLLTVALLTACGGGGKVAAPNSGIKGVTTYRGMSHEHIRGKLSYPQSPPVGGRHSPAWLQCAVYTSELPKENAVHSEEHGGVWLTYLPTLPKARVAQLADLARTNVEFVLVSPYPGQPAPVIASTWGAQLRVNSASDPRLLAFIKAYAGGDQGGEKGVGCRTTGLTLAKVRSFNAQK